MTSVYDLPVWLQRRCPTPFENSSAYELHVWPLRMAFRMARVWQYIKKKFPFFAYGLRVWPSRMTFAYDPSESLQGLPKTPRNAESQAWALLQKNFPYDRPYDFRMTFVWLQLTLWMPGRGREEKQGKKEKEKDSLRVWLLRMTFAYELRAWAPRMTRAYDSAYGLRMAPQKDFFYIKYCTYMY